MTAKEYLSQAYHIDQRINCKMEQIKALRELATKVNSVLSDMPKARQSGHIMEKNIAAIIDLENEINNDINKLLNLKKEIAATIRSMNDFECQTLLELRYLNFRTWEQVADKMGYSKQHVFRIHSKALNLLKIS
mgnify:CR=1 FL=1